MLNKSARTQGPWHFPKFCVVFDQSLASQNTETN
nr:hypothetical protein [Sicyoidochytrium minutum DNA virus]